MLEVVARIVLWLFLAMLKSFRPVAQAIAWALCLVWVCLRLPGLRYGLEFGTFIHPEDLRLVSAIVERICAAAATLVVLYAASRVAYSMARDLLKARRASAVKKE